MDALAPLFFIFSLLKLFKKNLFYLVIVILTISYELALSSEIKITNFHKVNENIYRGGRPTEEGIKELKRMGIKSILNLEKGFFNNVPRYLKQEERLAKEAGIIFLHVPMHPLFSPKEKDIEKAIKYLADSSFHPMYIHCERGSDRTGIVIAAYRIKIEGWSYQKAYEEMKKFGHRKRILFWWKNVLKKMSRENEKGIKKVKIIEVPE